MKEQNNRHAKAQSAMEYLMTYGWAILIIAVVLGALYSLGVFNAVNFTPKVPGGGCHVFRPNGPETSWNVNLVGSCNNALPQYVAQFNGQSSYVVTESPLELGTSFSIAFWMYPTISTMNNYGSAVGAGTTDNYFSIEPYPDGRLFYYIGNGAIWGNAIDAVAGTITGNNWYYVVATQNNGEIQLFVDGASKATGINPYPFNQVFNIGIKYVSKYVSLPFNGSIANVQIYNTSLTANQVAYLYHEGIGGVPISPQYLVGWWPLNGDTNDYSGNNNNGAATAVTFNGTWTSGYTTS